MYAEARVRSPRRQVAGPSPTRSSSLRFTRPESVRNLAVGSVLMGLGAALIDSYYWLPDHNVLYYYGWGLLAVAIGVVAWTFAEDVIEPTWAHLGVLAVGVYGWWNVAWTLLMVRAGQSIDSVHGMVILANLGVLWPFNGGLVEVSLALFLLSTVLAVAAPLATYLLVRARST